MGNRCTMLVNSCDKYADTWFPFFKILTDRWKNIPYPIVLNTESRQFSFDGLDITCFSFYPEGKNVPWGRRLKRTLKAIDSEYILFMLDDFYLLGDVDADRIEQCMKWMDEDHNIAVFCFWDTPGQNIQDGKYPGFEKRPQNGEYRLNCQAAVWRREHLIRYIRDHENPWEWELLGSVRSSRYQQEFYSLIEGTPLVIPYDYRREGYGVVRGKWTPSIVELFEKHEIQCDFSKRGFLDSTQEQTASDAEIRRWSKEWFTKDWKNRLNVRLRRFLSLR